MRVAETAEGTARKSEQGMSKETAALVERVISKMATESAKLGVLGSRMSSEMTISDAVGL